MVVSTVHELAYRGKDILEGNTRDFVKCKCGVKIIYEFGRQNPWDLLAAHIKEMESPDNPTAKELEAPRNHSFAGTSEMSGLNYVHCSCGWRKKLRNMRNPHNVWEGHRGFHENKERKEARQNKSPQPSRSYQSNNNHKGSWWKGNSWTGGGYGYKKDWERIEPIAKEVFGGTFFVVSVNTQ